MFRSVSEGFYKHNYEFVFPLLVTVAKRFNVKINDWDLKSMEENPDNMQFVVGQTTNKLLYLSSERVSVSDGDDYVAFICCHEMGHVKQYNNGDFTGGNMYRNIDMSNFDYLSRPVEQDATIFALETNMFDITKIKDETFKEAIKQLYIDRLLKPILRL